MNDGRSHPKIRQGAVMLSSLVLTPDSALAAYRKQRSGDPDLDLERLTQARGVLDAIAQAISSGDGGRWQRVARAFALLEADARIDTNEQAVVPPTKPREEPSSAGKAHPENAQAPSPPPVAKPPAASPKAMPPESSSPASVGPMRAAAAAAPSPWSTAKERSVVAPVLAPVVAPVLAPVVVPRSASFVTDGGRTGQIEPSIDGTAEFSVDSLALGDPLPFDREENFAPLPLEPNDAHVGRGETACFPAIAIEAEVPSQPEPPSAPRTSLTLEQYACYCVERALYPAAATRVRYRIVDEAAERALDGEWRAVLDVNASVRADFEARCDSYRAWLTAR